MVTGKARIRHTRKAIFLSLFIAEKCFRRDNTAESRGLSGATLSSTIHGLPDNTNNRFYVLTKIKKTLARLVNICILTSYIKSKTNNIPMQKNETTYTRLHEQ
jgi:hypothetical protein